MSEPLWLIALGVALSARNPQVMDLAPERPVSRDCGMKKGEGMKAKSAEELQR